MVPNGLIVLVGAGVLFGVTLPAGSAHGEDIENKMRTQLAVQTALQQGRDHLQRGNYQKAVECLESQIARVDGNRAYLNALRDAYRGYIRDLREVNRYEEARKYQERLKILDTDNSIERNEARPASPPTIAALASQTAPAPPTTPQAVETGPKPGAGYTARPQMPDEHDPFADSNSVQQLQIRELLDRARQEFDGKNYAAADRLFEQVNRIDSHATIPFRDLWAYCKMYSVVDTVRKSEGGTPAGLENEVQAALGLTSSPKLESYGKDLLRQIQARREGRNSYSPTAGEDVARIEVRHTPPQPPYWAVAKTTNFRVLHNQSRELAEQVARIAEATRTAMTRKWFGEDPQPWDHQCTIVLYANARDYAKDTGKPQGLDGHSTLKTEGERVLLRRIDLHCDVPTLLTKVLPHETTHVVLSGRFGMKLVPRWVDEGVAVLTEPREQIERHLRNLPMHRGKGELFSVKELMTLENYPEPRLIGAFYAQSISLVEFLSSQKGGPQEFARFVRDGLEKGYEKALRSHYGFKDFSDLEQHWKQSAFDNASGTAAMYSSRR